MAYETLKIISILAFWLIMVIFSLLPICIKKFRTARLLVSLCNCFTAGLFIANGFLHVLPEAADLYKEENKKDEHDEHDDHDDHGGEDDHASHSHGISYPHLTLLLAFSFIMMIEKVLLNQNKSKSSEKSQLKSQKTFEKINQDVNIEMECLPLKDDKKPETPSKKEGLIKTHLDMEILLKAEGNQINAPNGLPETTNNINLKSEKDNNLEKTTKISNKEKHDDGHNHDHMDFLGESSGVKIVVTLFALGIHAFMANLAVGIDDNKDTLITLIISIFIHKWCEGLALGIILAKSNYKNWKKVLIALFKSIFTPLGGFIGLALESANNQVRGILLSVSAAAFIYIAVMELIVEEFHNPKNKYSKFLFYCLGIGVVLLPLLVG